MRFSWKKKGLLFSPNQRFDWMYNYAQCPFALEFDNFIRVYFATRERYKDNLVRAFGGFVDLDKNNLKHIIRVSDKPILQLGGIGEFDEFGTMPISVVRHCGMFYLYYVGWTRCYSTPYDWEIGFAVSKDGENFSKVGKGPLLGPTLDEPYLNSTPVVYKFSDNDWHMFYHTGVRWLETSSGNEKKLESQYLLKHATSTDGINWIRNNKYIIPRKFDTECQTTPAIFYLNGEYHAFFCYRKGIDFRDNKDNSYRIGYASSKDFVTWEREDSKAGIDVSNSGWDSQMIEYPSIFKFNDKYLMFYCGNHFGRDGFGYAELDIISSYNDI